jgi:hypothetical protein
MCASAECVMDGTDGHARGRPDLRRLVVTALAAATARSGSREGELVPSCTAAVSKMAGRPKHVFVFTHMCRAAHMSLRRPVQYYLVAMGRAHPTLCIVTDARTPVGEDVLCGWTQRAPDQRHQSSVGPVLFLCGVCVSCSGG